MFAKKVTILSFLILTISTAVAQQDAQFSQNMFNQMAINPAYAGSSDMICATAINRMQWVGFGEGAPATTVVNINSPFTLFGLSQGAGLNIINDRFGFNTDIGLNLAYAARFKIEKAGNLAVGFSAGVINNSLKATWKYPMGDGDDAVPKGEKNPINFDLGFGVYYNNDLMYFGVSASHLNQPKLNNALIPSHYKIHYYLTGGYIIPLSNKAWELSPSVFIGSNLTNNILTLNTNVIYNKRFWGGVSYRMGEAFTTMLGVEIFSGLRIGYAFDVSTTKISSYNSGSHEFMLGYCFTLKKEKPPQQYKSIRFL